MLSWGERNPTNVVDVLSVLNVNILPAVPPSLQAVSSSPLAISQIQNTAFGHGNLIPVHEKRINSK